jgi:hypothetical protein
MNPSNWRFWGLAGLMGILSLLTGCASVSQGLNQPIRIDVLSPTGQALPDADCRATNDKGSIKARSNHPIGLRRSRADLLVQCVLPGQGRATGTAISRPNLGFAGNLMLGGVFGAALDDSNGTAYTYPTWIQLVLGEDRLFDRSGHRDESLDTGTFVRKIDTDLSREALARPAAAPVR